MYTVKQLADLAQVSIRTLHYYDQIGLLRPAKVETNGYRYYDDAALLRLQQILFYREIGLELAQVKAILDSPDFELAAALRSHRKVLNEKIKRLQNLVITVDATLKHLAGETDMSKKKLFQGFSEKKQKAYEREIRLQYGAEIVNESLQKWNSYDKKQQQAVRDEGEKIYHDIVKAIKAGKAPQSPDVQTILPRWHNHIRYFYEPTLEILRGLGETYNTHPDFIANFQKLHPDLPQYLQAAVSHYVDDLEYAEIARLLSEDESLTLRE